MLITILFVINKNIAIIIFSLTFIALFFFRSKLPAIPSIKISKTYLTPPSYGSIIAFLIFILPAIFLFILYWIDLNKELSIFLEEMVVDDPIFNDLPPHHKPKYILCKLIDILYVPFIFFILHMALFNYEYFVEIKRTILSTLIESIMNKSFLILLFKFIPFIIFIYWVSNDLFFIAAREKDFSGVGRLFVLFTNNIFTSLFLLIVFWYFIYILTWTLINAFVFKTIVKSTMGDSA
jgi:hypothetical protein